MKKIVLLFVMFLLFTRVFSDVQIEKWKIQFDGIETEIDIRNYGRKKSISLQEISKILGWQCVACSRCGDDQLDIKGSDVLLVKWDSPYLLYSLSGKKIKLDLDNSLEGDTTFVSINILDKLGYKQKIDNKNKIRIITKGKEVLNRENDFTKASKQMTSEQLEEIIKTKSLWDGAYHPIEESEVALLDVRTPEEFAEGYIKGAVSFPLDKLKQGIPLFPKAKKIIVYCLSGKRSSDAALILRRQGFEDVENFGGINRWNGEVLKK